MDVFADADTQQAAHQAYKLSYANGGFIADEVIGLLQRLDLSQMVGFAYGSGFEAQPELLERIQEFLPLLGNRPIVVRNLKRARQFFMLLDALHIQHPAISLQALDHAAGWLQRHAGGSGGTHVMPAPAGVAPQPGYYYQQAVAGEPASMLFLADGQHIQVIGFNQQWVTASPGMPYRYGGIVGHAALSDQVKQQMLLAAQKLTSAVGLRGLNSLDVVVNAEQIWVLEINPRLSSTFDLYQSSQCNLLDLHVRTCSGEPMLAAPVPSLVKARQVLYAPHDLMMSEQFEWPQWVADVPSPNMLIAAHNPVCTVLAEADNAAEAHALVLSRKVTIENLIKTLN